MEIERGAISATGSPNKYGIQGSATVIRWLRKYGSFDWENQTPSNMPKSKEQKILELEQKAKLLEKQKAFIEKQVERSDKNAIFFDMDEEEFNIPIRKTPCPSNQAIHQRKRDKHKFHLWIARV